MPLDPESIGGFLATLITGFLGKIGWDKYRKNQQQARLEESSELTLDRSFTKNETIAVWISQRIHKVVDDLSPKFNLLNLEDARLSKDLSEVKLTLSHLEKEVDENKRESDSRISDIHRHIEAGNTRLEQSFKREVDRIYELIKENRDRK